MMEANPHHYSERAIKTAKHGLSLKGKHALKIDQVLSEKAQAIKNRLWLPEEEKEQQNDIRHLKHMKKEWATYFTKSVKHFKRITKPAELNKLIGRLERN